MKPIPYMYLRGKEAQCPLCEEVFSTDRNCEAHKPWSKPITETCKDPASVGLKKQVRRNEVQVWYRPLPPEVAERRGWGNGGNLDD